ncbi:hypothetical protein V1512DRAFT_121508 [Lipomyces arxii]|uniref:uncharacterized protein n=1 Tax=Lipomyces arxii TaxID=56418 RepID=UPI0034CE8DB7
MEKRGSPGASNAVLAASMATRKAQQANSFSIQTSRPLSNGGALNHDAGSGHIEKLPMPVSAAAAAARMVSVRSQLDTGNSSSGSVVMGRSRSSSSAVSSGSPQSEISEQHYQLTTSPSDGMRGRELSSPQSRLRTSSAAASAAIRNASRQRAPAVSANRESSLRVPTPTSRSSSALSYSRPISRSSSVLSHPRSRSAMRSSSPRSISSTTSDRPQESPLSARAVSPAPSSFSSLSGSSTDQPYLHVPFNARARTVSTSMDRRNMATVKLGPVQATVAGKKPAAATNAKLQKSNKVQNRPTTPPSVPILKTNKKPIELDRQSVDARKVSICENRLDRH